jgi:hypothetical protein
MIAKIAHCFCVAERGVDGFKPLLIDLILGRTEEALHFVGGSTTAPAPDNGGLHKLRAYEEDRDGVKYLMAEVRLFCQFGTPVYFVVVGEI